MDELEDLEDSWAVEEAMKAIAKGEEELIGWEQVKADLTQRYAQQESC